MQDPQTVARIRRGDGNSLKSLFKSTFSECYAVAFRMTGSEEAARQCVVRAFEKLWKERKSIDPFNVIDLALLREVFLASSAYRTEHPPARVAVSTEVVDKSDPLVTGLSKLEEVSQLIFLLWAADGLSYREISSAVGLPEDAIKQRVGRSLTLLEPDMEWDEDDVAYPSVEPVDPLLADRPESP